MNSSTSNSKRWSPWQCISLTLLAVLVLLEVVVRFALTPHSDDYVRIFSCEGKAARLNAARGLKLAFIGNSATRCAIVPEILEQASKSDQKPINADVFVADGSEIHTWYYLAKKFFWAPHRNPDWLIVPFFDGTLEDQTPVEVGRLSFALTNLGECQEVFTNDLFTFADRVDFLLSSCWATYATRARMRERSLKGLIPDYEAYAKRVNSAVLAKTNREQSKTYHTLERFMAEALARGTKVCFVAFPKLSDRSGFSYEVDPKLRHCISNGGMVLLDMRNVSSLSACNYVDPIHLNREGAQIYTRSFLKAFGNVLADSLNMRM